MTDWDTRAVNQAVEELVERTGGGPEAAIPVLQAVQEHFRYLPEEALRRVCEITEITPADLAGVSTFYSQFRHRPMGRHTVSVCHGTACHVKGADRVTEALQRRLGLAGEEDTSADGLFTLQKVACLGCCTLAPAVQIDDVTYGHMTPERVPRMLGEFLELERQNQHSSGGKPPLQAGNGAGEIRIGLGSCCISRGSGRLLDTLDQTLTRLGIQANVKQVGCVGICHQTPLLEVIPPGEGSQLYARVLPEDTEAILLRHFRPPSLLKRIRGSINRTLDLILTGEAPDTFLHHAIHPRDQPVSAFLDKQKHVATACRGQIDPTDLDEYRHHGGFAALDRSLHHLKPDEVIAQVRASGLRGRGGAGYLTGLKWSKVQQVEGETRYVICNGDEGDPGAFMDRMLMESYPYRVIEGMIIAAYAVGAQEGYFYIRAEYPLAVRRIREALSRCEESGLLGERILGSDFSLDLEVREGAGAFVCGEESALLASIEGKRGTPRIRPPYPVEIGLRGKPTLVNNVETYALVPAILRDGPEAFSALGTKSSAGTKVFALAGKIVRGGLIEVPMGISLREVVEDIGGGVEEGRRFKAVQVGGPSGGCVPAEQADVPIDYESLSSQGAIMGSGGLVVLDDQDCMVDMARYFLEFTRDQSCGKCTFCRVGTLRMLDILEKLCEGRAVRSDLDRLESLAALVQQGSLCGLGKTAPNPVLTTLRHFRDEYEAHLEGTCPAGRCRALVTMSINDDCIGCTLCAQHCSTGAIVMRPYEKHEIDVDVCGRCGTCAKLCPVQAIGKR